MRVWSEGRSTSTDSLLTASILCRTPALTHDPHRPIDLISETHHPKPAATTAGFSMSARMPRPEKATDTHQFERTPGTAKRGADIPQASPSPPSRSARDRSVLARVCCALGPFRIQKQLMGFKRQDQGSHSRAILLKTLRFVLLICFAAPLFRSSEASRPLSPASVRVFPGHRIPLTALERPYVDTGTSPEVIVAFPHGQRSYRPSK